jgi:hypothetical protein
LEIWFPESSSRESTFTAAELRDAASERVKVDDGWSNDILAFLILVAYYFSVGEIEGR